MEEDRCASDKSKEFAEDGRNANASQLGREFLGETVDDSSSPSQANEPAKSGSKLSAWFQKTAAGNKEKWSQWKSGFESKKEALLEQHLPQVRELRQKATDWQLNVKEQVNEKKHKIMNQVVSGLTDGTDTDAKDAATAAASAANEEIEAKRWWAEACKAAHDVHKLELDPPKPPDKAFSEAPGTDHARGCLEVEVLSFGAEPTMRIPGGDAARRPVCQFALGSRYTGHLLPRISRIRAYSENEEAETTSFYQEAPSITVENHESSSAEESGTAENGTARFPIDEITGRDLRLHVFDSKARKFLGGGEDEAFCGGALIPLNILTSAESWTECIQGFRKRAVEREVSVKLLPLEAVRMVRKLKPATEINHSLDRPSPELGSVSLRLQLTLYDMAPGALYTAMPFCGGVADASGLSEEQGKLDDPMSVLKAVAMSTQRVSRALNLEFWASVANELRESPGTAAILHVLWAAATLTVPVWNLPAIFLTLFCIVVFRASSLSKSARLAEPPKLYKDEFEEMKMSLTDMTKKGLASAVKVELGMMKFAKTLNAAAAALEKLNYLLMMRDPYLSILFGGFLAGAAVSVTVSLGLFLAIFGRYGPPLLLWASGSLLLLPRPARARLLDAFEWLQDMKIRYLGEGKIGDILECLWARIPDEIEAQHCEIFERYCEGEAASAGSPAS